MQETKLEIVRRANGAMAAVRRVRGAAKIAAHAPTLQRISAPDL
jgi:hypothetical protein